MKNADNPKAGFDKGLAMIVAGGGTGGHLFPGMAIARAFLDKSRENRVLFVSAGLAFEKKSLEKEGFSHQMIAVQGIKGKGRWAQLKGAMKIPGALAASFKIIKSFSPDMVIGVGGYSAGPVVMAARMKGIFTAICEQNILPGVTNRMLFKMVSRAYVSFPDTKGLSSPKKTMLSGNPIRQKLLSDYGDHMKSAESKGESRDFTVLVLGGSLGAHALNVAVMEALPLIKGKKNIFFIHQTGTADESQVKKAHDHHGGGHLVKAFFDDMAFVYAKADLVICRAGATTVAEIAALGKAAIFIPYPFAADNHQVLNARAMVDGHAAEMMLQNRLDGTLLAERIAYYEKNRPSLNLMADKAKQFGRPDAAKTIVEDCYEMIKRNPCI